jgi:predicted dehydrogenase
MGSPGVVVVGTAFGNQVLVPAARRAGLDVVALVGRDPDKTARRAERSGVPAACTSLAEALRLPRADVVVVATPPATHAELSAEAIAAGRHVLVEKPFTVDAAEGRRLAEAADRAGVVALVGHEFRFAPARMTMQHAIAAGLIGTPRLGTVIGHTALATPLDLRAPEWWFDPTRAGGWLGAAASHLIDAIRVWLGEYASVSATLPMVSRRDPATSAEDSVSARFRMTSGCEVVLQESAAVWGTGFQLQKVAGSEGTLEIRDGEVLCADAGGTRTLEPAGAPATDDGLPADPLHGPATAQMTVLRDLVTGGTPRYDTAPATFADGVACMEVLDAMRSSAAAGGALVPLR